MFAQVNIPIFGDNNALPGLRQLELEALLASRPVQRRGRHQQSEDRLQLVADRRPAPSGRLGHQLPRAGVRRNLARRQRRHQRLEYGWFARQRREHHQLLYRRRRPCFRPRPRAPASCMALLLASTMRWRRRARRDMPRERMFGLAWRSQIRRGVYTNAAGNTFTQFASIATC